MTVKLASTSIAATSMALISGLALAQTSSVRNPSNCANSQSSGFVQTVPEAGRLTAFRAGSPTSVLLVPLQLLCSGDRVLNMGEKAARLQINRLAQPVTVAPKTAYVVPAPLRANPISASVELFLERFREDQTRKADSAGGRGIDGIQLDFPTQMYGRILLYRGDVGQRAFLQITGAGVNGAELTLTNEDGQIVARGANAITPQILSFELPDSNGIFGAELRDKDTPSRSHAVFEVEIKEGTTTNPELLSSLPDGPTKDQLKAVYQACKSPSTHYVNARSIAERTRGQGLDYDFVVSALQQYARKNPATPLSELACGI